MHELVLRNQRVVGLYFAVFLPQPIVPFPAAGPWDFERLQGRYRLPAHIETLWPEMLLRVGFIRNPPVTVAWFSLLFG